MRAVFIRAGDSVCILVLSWICRTILQAAPNRQGQEDNNEGCSIGRIVELKRLCGSSDPETSKLESKNLFVSHRSPEIYSVIAQAVISRSP